MRTFIALSLLLNSITSNASAGYFDYGKFCLQDGVRQAWINPSSHRSANGNVQFLVSFGDRCWTDNGWNFKFQFSSGPLPRC